MIIRPSFTVVAGAGIGLVAGAVVYVAVSTVSTASAASVTAKPAKAVAASPLPAASCAAGQRLEDGFCVIHVQRTVVVAAPAVAVPVAAAPSASRAQAGGVSAVVASPQRARPAPLTKNEPEAKDREATEGAVHESPEHSPANGAAGEAPSQVNGAAAGD